MRVHVNDQSAKRDRYLIKVLCRFWLLDSDEIPARRACNQSVTLEDSVCFVTGPDQVHNPLQDVAARGVPVRDAL
jgi:hypothetical protein